MRSSGTVLASPASDQGFAGGQRSTPLPVEMDSHTASNSFRHAASGRARAHCSFDHGQLVQNHFVLSLEKGNCIAHESHARKLERASKGASLHRTHSTEMEGGPALGSVSAIYDSYQYFGVGHWTYACDDRARGTRRSVPVGQARGARLVARGKSRTFDGKSSPLASGPAPLAHTVAIAAEAFTKNV